MATPFISIYNRFLGKVTDDMYLELTPEDTIKDLQNILIQALPGFEFPRFDLYDYTISQDIVPLNEAPLDAFFLKRDVEEGTAVIECSHYNIDLTSEEINILAILMKNVWIERQLVSIENTRMKYSGSDFKMTSQANHLSKLLSLANEGRRDSLHMQRLYRRRRVSEDTGRYESNWNVLREDSAIDY